MFAGSPPRPLRGYEIHMGFTLQLPSGQEPEQALSSHAAVLLEDGRWDGLERSDGLVFGTYLHGLFDNEWLTDVLLGRLAVQKGVKLERERESTESYKERQYDKLAALVRGSLDMKQIYAVLERGI